MPRQWQETIDYLVVDRDLLVCFLGLFSRFEYSLKRTQRYLRTPSDPTKECTAEADWDHYAEDLKGRFGGVQRPAFRQAVEFLIKEPPKRQVVVGGKLDWREAQPGPGENHERYVLRLVRTVRNNLFHGGKYPPPLGPVEDVARNRDLINAAIVVLDQCLELSPSVRVIFLEAA